MIIYLDYASHTPVSEAVLAAFCETERRFAGNPLSAHQAGAESGRELARLTSAIAEMLGVCSGSGSGSGEIIFTSGASEANNLAIKGIAHAYGYRGRHILSTCLEHPSVSGVLAALQDVGYEVELVRILPCGSIDLEYLASAIRPDTILVCVSAVDSELGVIQPIGEISKIVDKYPHCHLHIDAAQAVGKMPIEMHTASTMCISPHKFYGVAGSGVLVRRDGVVLEPLIHGGGASLYRGGTPALGLAAACHRALETALANQDEWLAKVASLRGHLIGNLTQYPLVRVNSPAGSSPYILNISVKGVKATTFTTELGKRGVCVSIKSACSTDNAPSRPVMAVSRDKQNALSSWRISLSHMTTMEELDAFIQIFNDCYTQFFRE